MSLFLDTNVVIKLIQGRQRGLRQRLDEAAAEGVSTSISTLVLYELHYGAERNREPERALEKIRVFVAGLTAVEPFNAEDGAMAGKLRQYLAKRGQMIGPYDLLIAAQALRLDRTLVTGNVREFSRVPGLRWVDWTAA